MPYYASEDDMGGLLTGGDLNEYGIERAYSIGLNTIPLTDLSLPWVD